MPGFARVAGEFSGKVTTVAVDIGPFVGLGSHEDGVRLLRITGTNYPAGYAVDREALTQYGVLGTPTSMYFDRHGKVVRKIPSVVDEGTLRSMYTGLAASQ